MSNLESFYSEDLNLDDKELHHLITVKRYKVGDDIYITDGKGNETTQKITSLRPFETLVVEKNKYPKPKLEITLILALIKGVRFETAIEGATELGINNLILWKAQRSIVNFDKKLAKELEKVNNLLISSSKQSRRVWYPSCQNYLDSKKLYKYLKDEQFDKIILAYENSDNPLENITLPEAGKIALIIGPEGGITDEEICEFKKVSVIDCSLSKNILRTSTAVIVALTKIIRH